MSTALERDRVAVPIWTLAAALAAVWLLLAPPTPDLAAQVFRATLFRNDGFAVWDSSWYGGHNLPGYSLLYPPLAAMIGPRLLGALAITASTVLFERLMRAHFPLRAARWATVWFAFAALGDLMIGRITFALGVTFGLACLLALDRGKGVLAVIGAIACAAASPVAGAFVVLAAFSVMVAQRSRAAAATALAAAATVLAMALGFPEGGVQPYPITSTVIPVAATIAVALLAGPTRRPLQIGAWLYAPVCILASLIPSPLGENVARLGVLCAGPLLIALILSRPAPIKHLRVVVMIAAVVACWQLLGPLRETAKGAVDPSTAAVYHQPVIDYFAARGGKPFRVEVPFTRAHWEAAYLAPHITLARGWSTQLDVKYGALFYNKDKPFSSDEYHRWLKRNAVSYIAVPDAAPDPSSRRELEVIAEQPSWLKPLWSSAHWKVYKVTDSRPLLSGPGELVSLGRDRFTIQAHRAAPMVVRVRWTSFFTATEGSACLAKTPGGWTEVTPVRPGRLSIAARFDVQRMAEQSSFCTSAGDR
ncbi:MAG: hypothetical protein F2813_05260 [Actinobacteria bacterium]|uniref:Unannotated protein n=1 Tax=freshwater metagenome TaxID=449393 RepID=A0A6J5ZVC5_9ZZZZ|nr:hypothetical protein [Actinomycetota bacterium]